jgi:metabolite-proton symporter
MFTATTTSTPAITPDHHMRRVVAAGFMGTTMETYDLYLYGTASALVFSEVFFPNFDPVVGLLLSLSTFAVSFIARPLGALVFGHFGDRLGRKNMLYITLLMMGISTALIGILPTYDVIGVLAPAILVVLRFMQGFGFGGEYAGAVLMIAEHSPTRRRGFYAGLNNVGPAAGYVLSTLAVLVLSAALPEEQFITWGWRIPFLASAVLVVIGLFLRRRVAESPLFDESANREAQREQIPLVTLFRTNWKELVLASGAMALPFTVFYLFSVYTLAYITENLTVDRTLLLFIFIVAMIGNAVTLPWFAGLSDRLGRRLTFVTGLILTGAWQFPFWLLVDTGNPWLITVALCVQMIFYGAAYGPMAAFAGELFNPKVRYTGMAFAYNIAGIIGAAPAPIIATFLLSAFGGVWAIALYAIGVALVSIICTLLLPETRHRDLTTDNVG